MKHIKYLILAVACSAMSMQSCKQNNTTPAPVAVEDTAAIAGENGEKLTDVMLPDHDGKQYSLLDEVKKNPITIIDFWASWCGPCMQEMPNVKALYEQFGKRGLGIIGISLDKDETAWKETVDRLGLTWLQLFDNKEEEHSAAAMYHVEYIPYTMLVDSAGTILETNLRGEELEQAVAKRLDK